MFFIVEKKPMNSCYLISHPKCGRTWLRVMLARVQESLEYTVDTELLQSRHGTIEGSGIGLPNEQHYLPQRMILLVRDPRDVVISWYFHLTRRKRQLPTSLSISNFIRSRQWGIRSIVVFYNEWYKIHTNVSEFLLIRYEDLSTSCFKELKRVADFLALMVPSNVLEEATVFASFENMQTMEKSGRAKISGLLPPDSADPEAHKVRRGEIGGYVDYLSELDVVYVNKQMDNLDSIFKYKTNLEDK